jgi:hypothetical protein
MRAKIGAPSLCTGLARFAADPYPLPVIWQKRDASFDQGPEWPPYSLHAPTRASPDRRAPPDHRPLRSFGQSRFRHLLWLPVRWPTTAGTRGPCAPVLRLVLFSLETLLRSAGRRSSLRWQSAVKTMAEILAHPVAVMTWRAHSRCGDGRYAPESDRLLRCREMSRWAKTRRTHPQQKTCLFALGPPRSRSQT